MLVGVLVGFVPHLRHVQLPPEVVLLLFLPALLYWESLTTSLREIRNNLRVVVLTSTVLVVATAAAVAAVAHALGLAWGPAWVLGAALAPTDATAVGVLARDLPRRTVTVLRAESLVNDGTALVLYGLAVGVTVGEQHLTGWHVTWLLVLAYGGGVLAGGLVGLVSWQLRRRMDDPMLEGIAMLVTPFAAFLLAEAIHGSGVLAVVSCGLFISQVTPRITGAVTRQIVLPFWALSTTVLSSALFVLVGLSAQAGVPRPHQHLAPARAGRRPRGDRRRDRGAVGVDLHHAVPHPAPRPPPGAAAAPGRCSAAHGERGGRVPRRRLARRGARRAAHAGLRCARSRTGT